MTFTTDRKQCGCTRQTGAPKCAECSPRRRRTADGKPTKHVHLHVGEILREVRERLAKG
ncbi:hypothetical protein OKW35_008515 [Paraburkholderia sp. MM5477-R1]